MSNSEETKDAANENSDTLDLNRLSLQEASESSASASALTKRDLFGGAISASIPTLWRDVSQVRQVPDHQEVYQDCTFKCGTKSHEMNVGTGGCIVVEILEYQEDVKDDDAAKYYFTDLAEANGSAVVESTSSGDGTTGGILYQNVWDIGFNPDQEEAEKPSGDGRNIMPRLSAKVKACSCTGVQSIAPLANKTELEEGKASTVKVELCVVRLEAIQTDLLISLTMPMDDVDASGNVDIKGEAKDAGVKVTENHHSNLFLGVLNSVEVEDWSLFLAG